MNFQQEFRMAFDGKYDNLSLKSVVAKKRDGTVIVTFLYPSTEPELSDEQKNEVTHWLSEKLSLEKMTLKVKFMRVFVEERLILKAIKEFFDEKFKLISTYTTEDSFKVKITPIDVQVEVELSSRLKKLFEEHNISVELAKFLKANFLREFVVIGVENPNLIDEVDIENAQMKATYKVTQRYQVQVLENIAGTGFKEFSSKQEVSQAADAANAGDGNDEILLAFPEKISHIKEPKTNVVVAGFLRAIERKDFVIKKGKKVGQSKAYYPFVLQDEHGRIDGVYFCPKAYEQKMETLAESDYVVMHGDVRVSQVGKLQLVADKIARATKLEEVQKQEEVEYQGPVVVPEKITALEQNFMFEQKNKYNRKIMGRTIVVFDIETTGLDRERDQIIELGAVKIDDGNIIERFSTFVKPTKHIPYEVTKLTGISEDMVADAPPIGLVIRDFFNFSKDCVLCGHNIIEFDMHFIRREGAAEGLDFDNEIIDTLNEARVARLRTTRFNLGTVTKLLGISLEGAHRAWNDAYATAQVLLKLNLA